MDNKTIHMEPIPFIPTDYSHVLSRSRARTSTRNTIQIPQISMASLIYGDEIKAEPRVIKREEQSARLACLIDVRGMNSAGVKALRRAVK